MSIDQPLVSVLMTSYNRDKYIADAINSVLASNYSNFELIIVDDGSKDNTVNIIRSFADKDSRVRFYQNEKNLGDYPNRNKAASHAKGKYLKYVDSDDYIYPWALENMVNMMEQYPEAGWGLCSMEPNGIRPFPFLLSPKEAYEYNYSGPGLFRRAPLSSIIKKEAFDIAGGFNAIRMAGDFEMWHRLGQQFSVVLMPQGMVWYRSHDAQEVNDYFKYITTYEKIKVEYLRSADCPLDKETVLGILNVEKAKIKKYIRINIAKFDMKMLKVNLENLKLYQ